MNKICFYFLPLFLVFTFSACEMTSTNESTPRSSVVLPDLPEGAYYYVFEDPGDGMITHNRIVIGPGKAIEFENTLFPNGDLTTGYQRLKTGTWTKNGDKYLMRYSYESCRAVSSERISITINGNLSLTVGGSLGLFYNEALGAQSTYDENLVGGYQEDTATDCDYF